MDFLELAGRFKRHALELVNRSEGAPVDLGDRCWDFDFLEEARTPERSETDFYEGTISVETHTRDGLAILILMALIL